VVVELALNGMNWSGGMRVMHCTEMVTGYKIGLHVDDVVLPDTGKAEEACKRRDLPQEVLAVKEQIAKSMRAYRLNESTWGLFGKSVRRKVAEVTKGLPEIEGTETEKCQRSQPRLQYDSGAYLLVPTYYGGKWLPAKVEDISKGGAGISMSPEIFKADIQRELMGDFRLDVSLPVLLGLGEEPDILWIPAEVAYSNRFSNGRVRAGLAFNTPKARKAFVG
jgi:hypothetical protein